MHCRERERPTILISRQMRKRRKRASTRRVELQVKRLNRKGSKERRCDAIISAFREMSRTAEITTTNVQAKVHLVLVLGETVVVAIDVHFEKLVQGFRVRFVGVPAFDHFFGAEVFVWGLC